MKLSRILTVTAVMAAMMLMASPAWAHVTVTPGEVSASGYSKLDFSVPHGCEEEATNSVAIQIPAGVVSLTPQVVPGWEIEMVEGPLAEPVELHGEMVTEGVTQVTWTGGPLASNHLEVFGLSVRIEGTPGDTLYFPVVQTCDTSEAAWIEIPTEEGEELDMPAPAVTLSEASDGHGHSDDTAEDDAAEGEGTTDDGATDGDETVAGGEASGADSGGSSDGAGPMTWIALMLGGLGAILGGAALATARRKA